MKIETLIQTYATDRLPHITDQQRHLTICGHLSRGFGKRDHLDIPPAVVQQYIARRGRGDIGKPSGLSTVRLELVRLNGVFNHARKHRLIQEKPHIDLPPEPEAKDRWLTMEEYVSLLSHADERTTLAMEIAIETAARPGFVAPLQWANVDLERGVIHFQGNVKVQTKKKRVPVPISDRLKPILETASASKGMSPYVLERSTTWYPGFKRATKATGMEDVTPHTLRHTKATWMAQSGVNLWKVAGVLGDSLDTVVKRYAHHHPDYLRDAVNCGAVA